MGSFALLSANITSIIGVLEDENVVLAFVDENLSEEEARAIQARILRIPNVSAADFIHREDALDAFIGRHENPDIFSDIDYTVTRHRFVVYVHNVELIAQTQDDLLNADGIVRVNANLQVAQGLVTARRIVNVISVVIVAVLLSISLFIMTNTIKLATFERREEIAIMRMVGATNSFIRWPFVYEGFILGISGSLAAFAALWALYRLVANNILSFEAGFVTVIPFANISLLLFVVFVAIGLGVGAGGSGIALNKYLKV
jgi:cell division transport system permease protein